MTTGAQAVWNKNLGGNSLPAALFNHEEVSHKEADHEEVNHQEVNHEDSTPSEEQNHQDALLQFSDISRKFIDSYSHLEKHIDKLSDELAAQTLEKEQQYQERARLAERLEGILSTLPSAVIVLDGHGRVQEFNTLAENMLGLPIIGETWLNIISRAFAPRSDDGHEISLKDGRRVKVETKALVSEPGQIILLTDLTDTRILQESQSRQQRLSVIGKMMASLAHQIRTPLSSALLYSGQISSQKLDAEQQNRFHKNLQHSLKQLERQVSDMLLFASGGVSSKQRFLLSDLVESIKLDLSSDIGTDGAGIEIECNINNSSTQDITLFGNMQSLLGAIANLIANSIHACRSNKSEGKPVKISILIEKLEQSELTLSVIDNGCGISNSHKTQVFKPFFTSRARGTGLGLAVVQTVINSFKGDVSITTKVDVGTTITISIPCVNSNTFSSNTHQMAGG